MCGVYGFLGKPDKKTSEAIKLLALFNESRGSDSTGIAYLSKDVQLIKSAHSACEYICEHEPSKYIKRDTRSIIGHTRAATYGAVTAENAHPFIESSLVLAHNGMISNTWQLKDRWNVNVDSQFVLKAIIEHGWRHALEHVIEGSYALTYSYTHKPNVMHFIRKSSPLYIAWGDGGKFVFYSSELQHLTAVMVYLGLPIAKYYGLSEGKHYIFEHDGDSITVTKKPFTPKQSYTYGYGYGANYSNSYYESIAPKQGGGMSVTRYDQASKKWVKTPLDQSAAQVCKRSSSYYDDDYTDDDAKDLERLQAQLKLESEVGLYDN